MKVLRIFILIDLALLIIFSQSKLIQANSSQLKAIITIQNLEQISEFFDKDSDTISKTIPFSLNLDGTSTKGKKLSYLWKYPEGKIYNSKNPRSYRFEKAGNYIITLKVTDENENSNTSSIKIIALEKTKKSKKQKSSQKQNFQNGNLSKYIFITEIFPNPKGKDQDKEWIELYNAGNSDINLGNWKIIQTNEKDKKPQTKLSDDLVIESKNFLTIKTKKALRNSQNTITLLDFENNEQSKIFYEKTEENKSFSLIPIKNLQTGKIKTTWQWTAPTKNKVNETLYFFEGKIIDNKIDNDTYKIKLESNSKPIDLIYRINTPNPKILELAFKKNNKIKALADKENNQYEIIEFEITKQKNNSNKETKSYYTEMSTTIIIVAIVTFLLSSHCKSFAQSVPL